MKTQEMINIADQNNKTYESKYGTYNKNYGFLFNVNALSMTRHNLANNLFHDASWAIKKEPAKKMTKEQIEKALGYKIEIVTNDKKKEKIDESKKPKNKSAEKGDVITIDELMRLLFGSED